MKTAAAVLICLALLAEASYAADRHGGSSMVDSPETLDHTLRNLKASPDLKEATIRRLLKIPSFKRTDRSQSYGFAARSPFEEIIYTPAATQGEPAYPGGNLDLVLALKGSAMDQEWVRNELGPWQDSVRGAQGEELHYITAWGKMECHFLQSGGQSRLHFIRLGLRQ